MGRRPACRFGATTSLGVLGSKSQFKNKVPGVSALGSARESGLNSDVRAQVVWRTGCQYPAHAFDRLG